MCTGGGGLICILCHDMCARVEVDLFVCVCHDVCARVEVGLFVFCVMTCVHGWRWAYLYFVS